MHDVPEDIRRIVINHHQANKSVRQIARIMNMPHSTVGYVIQKYSQNGQIFRQRRGRCGRPRTLSNRSERALVRASVANPQATARELQASVQGECSSVSIDTIKRTLRRSGRYCYRPLNSPNESAALTWRHLRFPQRPRGRCC